jgi:hypothetical protein
MRRQTTEIEYCSLPIWYVISAARPREENRKPYTRLDFYAPQLLLCLLWISCTLFEPSPAQDVNDMLTAITGNNKRRKWSIRELWWSDKEIQPEATAFAEDEGKEVLYEEAALVGERLRTTGEPIYPVARPIHRKARHIERR